MAGDRDIPDDFDQVDTTVIEQLLEEYGIEDVNKLDKDVLEDIDLREFMQRKDELVTEEIFDDDADNDA